MDLKLTLTRKWFDSHLGDKEDEYREIKPYWCNRFLTYDGKIKTIPWWKLFFELEGKNSRNQIAECLETGVVKFRDYESVIFSNGMKPVEILPRFEKPLNYIKTGIGNSDWGAPEYPVFILNCGKPKNVVNN